MDLGVYNLLKNTLGFKRYEGDNGNVNYISCEIRKLRYIRNARNLIGLGLNQLQPFFLHVFSTILHEHPHDISCIEFYVKIIQTRGGIEKRDLIVFRIENPRNNAHLFLQYSEIQGWYFDDDDVFQANKPFYIIVETKIIGMPTIMPDGWREEESDEEEPYTPPIKPYREDCCMACLESKPNILYLDCLHIAICDSCDRLKRTGRKNCDMCRSEISRRIAL